VRRGETSSAQHLDGTHGAWHIHMVYLIHRTRKIHISNTTNGISSLDLSCPTTHLIYLQRRELPLNESFSPSTLQITTLRSILLAFVACFYLLPTYISE